MLTQIEIRSHIGIDSLRLNMHQHRYTIIGIETLIEPLDEEGHFGDGSQADTTKLDRRPNLQPTDRIGEEHQHIEVFGIERILNAILVVIQHIVAHVRHRFPRCQSLRHIEAHAAAQQRRQGAHLDAHPLRRHIEGDTAVNPEAHILGHQGVIRGGDKQLIGDLTRLSIKTAGLYRADTQTTE